MLLRASRTKMHLFRSADNTPFTLTSFSVLLFGRHRDISCCPSIKALPILLVIIHNIYFFICSICSHCFDWTYSLALVLLSVCLQIYDMILVRHGLMIVGGPIAGKSSALRTLAKALGDLYDKELMEEFRVRFAFCIFCVYLCCL